MDEARIRIFGDSILHYLTGDGHLFLSSGAIRGSALHAIRDRHRFLGEVVGGCRMSCAAIGGKPDIAGIGGRGPPTALAEIM